MAKQKTYLPKLTKINTISGVKLECGVKLSDAFSIVYNTQYAMLCMKRTPQVEKHDLR